jgi:hypothetical protein
MKQGYICKGPLMEMKRCIWSYKNKNHTGRADESRRFCPMYEFAAYRRDKNLRVINEPALNVLLSARDVNSTLRASFLPAIEVIRFYWSVSSPNTK